MKFTPSQIRELAGNTRFPADNLEKVLRSQELLTEFHKHTILKGKLVLKGGTALNLFYLNLARLSVDIDLNYIGYVDREATLKDRPEIIKAVEQIAAGLGYQLQNGVDEYALREWHLNFKNHAGRSDRIQVEINFLMRACVLPPRELNAVSIGDAAPYRYLVLGLEEVFGGKTKAMIDRHHPRDLYDLYRFSMAKLPHNPELLRKLTVLFASTMDHDLRTYHMDRFKVLDQKELERVLYPLLRADDRPTAEEMLKTVSPLLASVLDHGRETSYLEAMASGRYIRPVVVLIGLEWYGWHGFRRGIASNLYELGADEKIVQRVLRPAKAHVTKDRYIKAFDPAVLAAMKRMETTLDAMKLCAPTVHQIN